MDHPNGHATGTLGTRSTDNKSLMKVFYRYLIVSLAVLTVTAIPAQDSLEALLQKVEAEPENTAAREKLANLYANQADRDFDAGREKTAFEAYKKAVKIAPNHPRASKRYWELKDKILTDTSGNAIKKRTQYASPHKHVSVRKRSYVPVDTVGIRLQALENRVFERLDALSLANEDTARTHSLILEALRIGAKEPGESPLLYVLLTIIVMITLGTLVSFLIFWLHVPRKPRLPKIPIIRPDEIHVNSHPVSEENPLESLSHDLKLQLIATAEKNWRSGVYSDHSFMTIVRSLSLDKDAAISEKARAVLSGVKDANSETVFREKHEKFPSDEKNTGFFSALPLVTLEAVADLIDLKTNRPGHSSRTAKLAQAMAKQMKLPIADRELIYAGALIHDIGMLELEESFFIKSEIYRDSQLDYLRQHPEKGGQIMKLSILPDIIRQILLEHHERYDGSGYPASTSGSAISIPALVVGCAETWISLTSYRPYRATLSHDAALYLMTVGEENKFPENVVDALRQAIRLQQAPHVMERLS
jgi:putative nucleotidyltransferase with HDIG domain